MFFNKKFWMMTKKSYLFDRFFESIQNFTTEHVKIIKNSRVFVLNFSFLGSFQNFSNSRFFQFYFCLNSKFQVFPGFQVKWQP